ncbi:MAG TPA: hypothetical protein DD979_01205 [Gammaproteobacteria bacterium]|nr:hypothetical protein [Gammaproteobacteria bacterium]
MRPAKLLTISLNNQLRQRTFPGQIEASRRSNLSFRVSGQLVEIPATPGMDVKQGDLLAKLDTTDFEHILAERKASLDLAKTRYNQIKKLFDKTYSTQAQLDEATATLRSAQAAVAIATDNLRYTSLTAPFDGIVARVDAKNFQTITAQQPFLQLHNVDDLDVVFTMPETLLQQMRNNIENPENVCAVVTFSAQTDQTYKACFKEFEGVPDPLTRGYKVVFTMPPIDEFPVLPGMSVNLVVDFSAYLRDAGTRGIQVPLSAVFEQENKSWVWKLDDDSRVTQTEVEVARI